MMRCIFQIVAYGQSLGASEPFAILQEAGRTVIVLCDGSGSWGAGIEAATAAAKPMLEVLVAETDKVATDLIPFEGAFQTAARCAADYSGAAGAEGVTGFDAWFSAVVALLLNGAVKLAWAGHTGALLIRDGRILEIGRARTLADKLAEAGTITPEHALQHPWRFVTTTGIRGGERADFDVAEWRIQSGDRLYLGRNLSDLELGEKSEDAFLAQHRDHTLLTVDIVADQET